MLLVDQLSLLLEVLEVSDVSVLESPPGGGGGLCFRLPGVGYGGGGHTRPFGGTGGFGPGPFRLPGTTTFPFGGFGPGGFTTTFTFGVTFGGFGSGPFRLPGTTTFLGGTTPGGFGPGPFRLPGTTLGLGFGGVGPFGGGTTPAFTRVGGGFGPGGFGPFGFFPSSVFILNGDGVRTGNGFGFGGVGPVLPNSYAKSVALEGFFPFFFGTTGSVWALAGISCFSLPISLLRRSLIVGGFVVGFVVGCVVVVTPADGLTLGRGADISVVFGRGRRGDETSTVPISA